MKELLTQEMNESEIKNGVKLFAKLMRKYPQKYKYNHANPIEQNCYISSGAIIGVFFPNSEIITDLHKSYKLISISKVNNTLGVVFALKDNLQISERAKIYFDNYLFCTFDELIFTREEREIKKRIETRIKDYEKAINTLNKIKRVYKKNGDNFARLLDNFTGVNMVLDYCLCSPVVSSIKINYNEIYIYRSEEAKKESEQPTAEELQSLIYLKKYQYAKYLEEEKTNLKQLESNFKKFSKIIKQLKSFLDSTNNKYDYKKEIEYMIL